MKFRDILFEMLTAAEAAKLKPKNVTFVAYHGTTEHNAELIRREGFKLMGARKHGELGVHFGGVPKNAYGHKGVVLKCKITLENPIYIDDYWEVYEEVKNDGYVPPAGDDNDDSSFVDELRRRLIEQGYDGLIGGYENIVFNPSTENIKVI